MKTRILDNAIGLTTGLLLSLTTVVILLGVAIRSEAETIEVSGEIVTGQNSQWSGGNVYLATDDVTVPRGVCLFTASGTTIKIKADKKITVYGRLIADGSSSHKSRPTKLF